jgi:FtsH-binding integral membrane protein
MTEQQDLLTPQENPDDKLSTGLQVLSFCIPLVGAVVYFSNKDKNPNKAKAACHAALWGIGLGILINILVTLMRQGH